MIPRGLSIPPGHWAMPLAILLALGGGASFARPPKTEILLIGNSGSLGGEGSGAKAKGALKTLKSFIKEETGMDNEIRGQKNWRELASLLTGGKLHLGVFQGDEFAWAKEKYPKLEPLALGINVDRYPAGCVMARRDGKIKRFADLRGKEIAVAASSPRFLFTFLRQQGGKKPEEFFSAMKKPETVEDALDDVVDEKVPAAVVEKATLEAYRRRKPGRFKQLVEVARSEPFPPVVIAYHPGGLDESLRDNFRRGLVRAAGSERGRTMLTLFRLTGFEAVPDDFGKVLATTRKTYPPPEEDPK